MRLRRHGALVAALLVVILAIGAGGCGSGRSDDDESVRAPGAVSPLSLERDLALFRRNQTDRDQIPEAVLPRSLARRLDFNMADSRVALTHHGEPVYVVRSDALVCTYSWRVELGNCWPPSAVARGLASATSICGLGTAPGKIATFGLVPDGVRRVTVLRNGRSDYSVPVRGNMYVAVGSSTPPLPLRIQLVYDRKRVLRPTGIPPAVAKRGCATRR